MLVSIIIPIYKVEAYILDCLSSVYAQKYNKIEIILVDDCSPDNSMLIAEPMIEELKKKYQIQIVRHEINKGLSAARNSGIKVATGDYIFFLDSDDELTCECICLMVDLINCSEEVVDFVVSGIYILGSNDTYPVLSNNCLNSTSEILSDFFEKKWPVMAWNKLIRRSLFVEESLWFEEGVLHEDELFSFILASRSKRMLATKEKTYIYKIRTSGSITSNIGLRNYESILRINMYRYQFIDEYIFKKLKIYSSMSFIIHTTFDFYHSVQNNACLRNDDRKRLLNQHFDLFFKCLRVNKKLSLFEYKRILLIIRYSFCLRFGKQ